jgi:hypothetical protein
MSSRLLPWTTLLALGCAAELPTPSIESVEPNRGYNGEKTAIIIHGESFLPRVEIDTRGGGERLDRQFDLRLTRDGVEAPVDFVGLKSFGEIEAWVPEGLAPGLYGLDLTSPNGHEVSLPRAFTVTDTRADHLSFRLDTVAYTVWDEIPVSFDLLDPEGQPVYEAMDIVFNVSSATGGAGLQVDASLLEDADVEVIDDGYSVTGRLNAIGHGFLRLTPSVEDNLLLEVSAADPSSVVRPDHQIVAVSSDSLYGVVVTLPERDFETLAGESFEISLELVDQWGNRLHEAGATLVLNERCGRNIATRTFVGSWSGPIAMQIASGTENCPENGIDITGTTSGSSDTVVVRPASVGRYGVTAYPPNLTAGLSVLYALVSAEDPYGNLVSDHHAAISLALSHAGHLADGGLISQSCPSFEEGRMVCVAVPYLAGTSVRALATGDDDLEGASNLLQIAAGPVDALSLSLPAGPLTAGTPLALEVQPLDAFGNPASLTTAATFTFLSTTTEPDCDSRGVPASGSPWIFDCVLTRATTAERLTVSASDLRRTTTAVSGSFEVWNGDLATVAMDFLPAPPFPAGSNFEVDLSGFDAYGNPWLHKRDAMVDPILRVEDDTGTCVTNPATVRIEEGIFERRITASITRAINGNRLHIIHGATEVGRSEPFQVVAGAPDQIQLDAARPWAFVGDALRVTATVVDAWSNPVTTHASPVNLVTLHGSAEPCRIDSFVGGMGETDLLFTSRRLDERLQATSLTPALEGLLDIDVLEDGCDDDSDGRADIEAVLRVGGGLDDTARVCLGGSGALGVLDLAASTGSASGWHFWDSVNGETSPASSSTTVIWPSEGLVNVEGVVHDARACGSLDSALVYIAEDDGQPVGPLSLTSSVSSVTVGSSTYGSATLRMASSTTCSGDAARGATVYLRSTLGSFTGGVAPTGHGLAMSLDATGGGTATWSVSLERHGGTAKILVGRLDGLALGSLELQVNGDDMPPHVLEVTPAGFSSGLLDTLEVRFDEALLTTRLMESVSVQALSGSPLVIDEILLSEGGSLAEIVLDAPVDLSTTPLRLTLSPGVRDLAGNRLDGDWDDVASPFVLLVGPFESLAPDMSSCVADIALMRPDGDDMPGTEESDSVVLRVEASGAPAWWVLEVWDELGVDPVAVRWVQGTGTASASLSWDGRLQGGQVASNGSYALRVRPLDVYLNEGGDCEVSVLLDNLLTEDP